MRRTSLQLSNVWSVPVGNTKHTDDTWGWTTALLFSCSMIPAGTRLKRTHVSNTSQFRQLFPISHREHSEGEDRVLISIRHFCSCLQHGVLQSHINKNTDLYDTTVCVHYISPYYWEGRYSPQPRAGEPLYTTGESLCLCLSLPAIRLPLPLSFTPAGEKLFLTVVYRVMKLYINSRCDVLVCSNEHTERKYACLYSGLGSGWQSALSNPSRQPPPMP